ncbi:MAG: ATP-dependent DNA helicase RecG [Clostridiales bacterium]|nr:ATP-dependent DNA helicase RecG [Clostridiales bacterium]
MAITLDGSIRQLTRIGEQRAKKLEKLKIYTPRDLLYWFPRDYQDLRQIYDITQAPVGEPCCVEGVVAERAVTQYVRRGMELTKTRVVDGRGQLFLTFFNQSYVSRALRPGEEYIFYGTVEQTGSRKSMTNPMFESSGRRHFTGRIMPVYPLTAGITNFTLSEAVRQTLVSCAEEIRDPLPEDLREEHHLVGLGYALQNIHFPKDDQALAAARRRLVFEELFFFSAGLAMMKGQRSGQAAITCQRRSLQPFWDTLPFAPTSAQRRAAEEAAADLCSGRPMNRLLQGDVGSGKTVVAAACAWLMAQSGGQTALMVPTEILARQHCQTLTPLLEQSGLRVGLLTGSMKAKEKRDVYERLQLGMIDLVVGTHALLTEGVAFRRLGLVITDEQHRFGVDQRAKLAEKGREAEGLAPHVLVMSATPIPRTLALILYGDLEVSVLDELPPGRQHIDTFLVGEDKRERMYGFVRRQVAEGHQVYIVCPSVSAESTLEKGAMTATELKAVEEYAEKLQTAVFPDLRVGLVHGRQSAKAKEQVMTRFAQGELDILVATTVIEVGVDVSNATLMVIENAERFGLSQLHQLRGRVGRGKAKSYCVLVSDNRNPETRQRMKALCATNDGFQIAEEDLKLRGPGDFFGARQHGLPQLRVADLAGDVRVLQEAQAAAAKRVADDPDLQRPENVPIKAQIQALFETNTDRLN